MSAAAVATEGPAPAPRSRIRHFPLVRQIDEMDCAVACLAMICRHFGRTLHNARVRQLTETDASGTSLRNITRAAARLGLASRAVRVPLVQAPTMPLPAMLHWDGGHWVVLYHIDGAQAWIADPALGLRRLPLAELGARWSGYAAIFDTTPALATVEDGRLDWSWMAALLRPELGTLARAGLLAVVVSALEMCFPLFTQLIVDQVLVNRDTPLLALLLGGMAGVLVVTVLATLIQRYLMSFVAVRLDAASLDVLMRHLLSLPLSWFQSRRTGDVQRRLAGVKQVREFAVRNGVRVVTSATQLAAALLLMSAYNGRLTLVFLATIPLYLGLMRLSAALLRPAVARLEEASGRYSSTQLDAIKGIETIKAAGAELGMRNRLMEQLLDTARGQFRTDFVAMGYEGLVRAATFVTIGLFLWFGSTEVMAGRLSIGGLMAFSTLVGMANAPLVTALTVWDAGQMVRVVLDRLADVFAAAPEQSGAAVRPAPKLAGDIQVEGLRFRFSADGPDILSGVSLDIPAGSRVAIVGRSGSGKTTLARLLAGLLEPTAGSVRYDGQDVVVLDHRDLRRQLGLVLQDSYLFADTIGANIAFGDDEPDLARVRKAALAANAAEFIERLPLGYDTRVGEGGLLLSGGQRQRLAIARALYHEPPVLIFDEATSALDAESERLVNERIGGLFAGRTAIVIAHRLSTVRDADTIVVLDQGRVVETGRHAALLAAGGLYAHLCRQQLES